VPGAGMGLFAARRLDSNTSIDYTSDRIPLESDQDGGAYFPRAVGAGRSGRRADQLRGGPLGE
jgi:hypothetical protein